MKGGIELNCTDQGNALAWLVVALDGGDKMFSVNANSDKDVECFDIFRRVYRHETAVTIVYQQIAT